jgi:hypothetical protein
MAAISHSNASQTTKPQRNTRFVWLVTNNESPVSPRGRLRSDRRTGD